MTWRKYFTPVATNTELSPISGNTSKAGPARTNYSSYLPDVYSGSPNRIERYQQYEVMDSDPEVNAALDILAEFCTQKLKDGKSPFTVKWRSKATNSEVKILGEYLQQWNKLQQFDTRIFRIVRNVYKYGDAFFIRDPETQKWSWIDPSKIVKIIVNESDGKKPEQYIVKDLAPNFENLVVTQITPNINPRQAGGGMTSGAGYMGSQSAQRGSSGPYPSSSSGSRFGLAETEHAIDAEHVVHLSLSEGLDNNYPFGNSLLENVYKVYKQKELLEDAILIYRIQRAPERRVFHIDVGNMPSHMAMAFVERVKNEIHQRRIPSQSGGGCFAMDTRVPLLDGRSLTIAELANEFKQGKENWAFSCNPETREMVPGLITWAGVTQRSAKVIELVLDNGETIICTPEHNFPIVGKGKVEAKDIIINEDSLISFNTRLYSINEKNNVSDPQYHQYFEHKTNKWVFTHRKIANFFKDRSQHNEMVYSIVSEKKSVIHHKDFNKYNNTPSNLWFMNGYDHFILHSEQYSTYHNTLSDDEKRQIIEKGKITKLNKSPDERAKIFSKISSGNKQAWKRMKSDKVRYEIRKKQLLNNLTFRNEPWQNQPLKVNDRMIEILKTIVKDANITKRDASKILSSTDEFMQIYNALNSKEDKKICKLTPYISRSTIDTILNNYGYSSWLQFLREQGKNKSQPVRKLKWDISMLKILIDIVKTNDIKYKSEAYNAISENNNFLNIFKQLNKDIKGNSNINNFSKNTFNVFLNDMGYNSWKDFMDCKKEFNHKVVSIRELDDCIEVGTLTIDGAELYHNFHTFAIEHGVYTYNSNVIDSAYNPLSINEDYFFPMTADGRGSKVDVLPGGTNLGEIDDLKYFTNKLFRGLRIPSSYLPTGADDSQASFNDGRVGTAYIQELRFNKYCERLQWLITESFDSEFKMYMNSCGVNIDSNLFELNFNPPMNFASTRQSALDSERINTFNTIQQVPFMSNRFALKRFLGLSDDEMADNERLWAEENGKGMPTHTDAAGEMRSAGLSAAGIEGDLGMAGDLTAPDGMEGDMPMDMSGTAAPPVASAPSTAPVA